MSPMNNDTFCEKLVLNPFVSSIDSNQPMHLCSLAHPTVYIYLTTITSHVLKYWGKFLSGMLNICFGILKFQVSLFNILLIVPRRYFFYGSFVFLLLCVCHAFASVHC